MKTLTRFYGFAALLLLFLTACSDDDGGTPATPRSFDDGNWVQKADFPGSARIAASGFAIGNKGYVICGWTADAGSKLGKEFWEYDQATDSWTQKDDFPGAGRNASSGFAIGEKGYLVCGWSDDDNDGSILGNQFWEWDQATDTWTRKNDFPGEPRLAASSFAIGKKGYLVCGWIENGSSQLGKEFWEWDQETDSWTQKDDFPGEARNNASGFAIRNKGYIACGNINGGASQLGNEIWEWDPTTDSWSQKADFPGSARNSATAFSIGNNAYLVCGTADNNNGTILDKEVWMYQ